MLVSNPREALWFSIAGQLVSLVHLWVCEGQIHHRQAAS